MERKGDLLKIIIRIICVAAVAVTAAFPSAVSLNGGHIAAISAVLFVLINVFPSAYNRKLVKRRHRICADGAELLIIFMTAPFVSAVLIVCGLTRGDHGTDTGRSMVIRILLYILLAVAVYSVVFWNGIIRIYTTSVQLGIRYRVWGIILGWVFPANLVMLTKMIRVVSAEVWSENARILRNRERSEEQICKTRYPILMVHGVFFRDFKQGFLNYWGRIPDELRENGAVIYFGNQQSAASVARCGEELAERIRQIVEDTGCEKVNIIAHSKGGLDSRHAVSKCGAADMVASITTINTPHRGCEFADYLLEKIPASVQSGVAGAYNASLRRLGDHDPDFMEAVTDLTHGSCTAMNESVPDAPGVYYQSFGSRMKKAGGGRFPLNYSFHLVKYFDGPNDGLVGEKSFSWGERYEYLEPAGDRGISHGDMIDLNRENIDGFDVREFYVDLVHDLKNRGF